MKILKYAPFLMVFLMLNCMAQDKAMTFKEIIYSGHTRGAKINIKVVDNKIYFEDTQNKKEIALTKEDVKELSKLIKSIDLKGMYDLTAPSNRRSTDGAMHAEFQITTNNNEYKSCMFDAGNAPEELKKLEDLLYKISGVK